MKTKDQKISELKLLLKEPKFVFEHDYTGIEDEELREVLTNTINISLQSFLEIVKTDGNDYLSVISRELKMIEPLTEVMDTEDRQRVCEYYELMMAVVELESSGGLLNGWMYGFDPSSRNVEI